MIRAVVSLALLACTALAAPAEPAGHCIFNSAANPELCAALEDNCPRDLQYYTKQLESGEINDLFRDCAEALCCFCDGGDSTHPSCTSDADFGQELGRATLNEACETVLEETDLELGCEDHSGAEPAGDEPEPRHVGDQCECDDWGWHHWHNHHGHHDKDRHEEEEEEEDRRRHNHRHGHHHHGWRGEPLSGYVDVDGNCDCTYDQIVHSWALAGLVLTVIFAILITCCCCRRCRRRCKKHCEERCARNNAQASATAFTNHAYNMDDVKQRPGPKSASTLPPVYPVDSKLAEATVA